MRPETKIDHESRHLVLRDVVQDLLVAISIVSGRSPVEDFKAVEEPAPENIGSESVHVLTIEVPLFLNRQSQQSKLTLVQTKAPSLISRQPARTLMSDNVTVVLTAGGLGALLISLEGETSWVTPSPEVSFSEIVDTRGAGDCFAGAFAYELARISAARGVKGDIEHVLLRKAAQLACDAAALSIQRRGCVASYTYVQEKLYS